MSMNPYRSPAPYLGEVIKTPPPPPKYPHDSTCDCFDCVVIVRPKERARLAAEENRRGMRLLFSMVATWFVALEAFPIAACLGKLWVGGLAVACSTVYSLWVIRKIQ